MVKMSIQSKDTYGHEVTTYDYAVNKWGSISDIDTADISAGVQVIWPVKAGTQVYKWIDTPIALTIESTSADDVPAVGTLTLTGQPADTETVTIGTKVYTFQTTLTNVDGNVKIGANASGTIDNLIAAINLTAGAGTTYAALMTENDAGVYAAVGAGDTMTLYVNTATEIDTTEAASNTAWGATKTVLGTGAHTVSILYHDFNGYEKTETFPLRGVDTTPIATSYGVFRITVLTSGTGNKNAGQLKVMNSTNIYATVEIGESQTQIACYRVPNDHTGTITFARCGYGRTSPSTNTAGMRLRVRRADGTIVTKHDPFLSNITPKEELRFYSRGPTVRAGEWVFWECISVSANDTPVDARFEIELTRIPDFEQG